MIGKRTYKILRRVLDGGLKYDMEQSDKAYVKGFYRCYHDWILYDHRPRIKMLHRISWITLNHAGVYILTETAIDKMLEYEKSKGWGGEYLRQEKTNSRDPSAWEMIDYFESVGADGVIIVDEASRLGLETKTHALPDRFCDSCSTLLVDRDPPYSCSCHENLCSGCHKSHQDCN